MLKQRIYEIIEPAQPEDRLSKLFEVLFVTLITLNVFAVIMSTVDALMIKYKTFFYLFELFSVIIFSIEYTLRLWTANLNAEYSNPISGRLRFAITPMLLIDLLAILPFYLPIFFGADLRFLRAFRLMLIFRIFKMARYIEAVTLFKRVFKKKKEELILSMSAVLILTIVSASIMYFVENKAQPEAFSSIPATMWWAIATLTTVGYGDIYPVTVLGKLLGAVIAVLGIGMFALPTGILASGFSEALEDRKIDKQNVVICPHCQSEVNI